MDVKGELPLSDKQKYRARKQHSIQCFNHFLNAFGLAVNTPKNSPDVADAFMNALGFIQNNKINIPAMGLRPSALKIKLSSLL